MPMQVQVRVGHAGNGTPVFLLHGANLTHGRVFGATWDQGRSLWMYPAFFPAAGRVLEDFSTLAAEVDVVWSDTALQHIKALEQVQGHLTERRLPEGFTFVTKPYDHQIDGLCHVYYNLRAALFYEQGLGKSKIAVDMMRLLRLGGNRAPALVLGPRMTVQNWGREIDFHGGGQLKWVALVGTLPEKKKALTRAIAEGADMVLATYGTATSLVDLLVDQLPYKTLICDECHYVKSWDSNRTKATWEIAQKAARRTLMTGSPTQGSPLDLYGTYKILGDCFMPEEYFLFKKKFLQFAGANSRVVTGYKNLDILNARTTFLSTRRTKEECLDLPERVIVDVEYSLSKLQTGIHNQLVDEMRIDPGLLAAQLGLEAPTKRIPPEARMAHRAATLSKLLQVASGFLIKNENDPSFCDRVEEGGCKYLERCVEKRIRPRSAECLVDQTPLPNTVTFFDENPKLDAVEELLVDILQESSHKVIVWCVFRHELDIVEKMIKDRQWGYVRVDGSTDDVQVAIDQFNLNESTCVYLAQASTGVGITLNAASYMVYCSLPFSLNTYTQSLDRNYRIGQDKKVTVYRLLGRGTPEMAVAKLLDNKVDVDVLLTKKIDCLICPHHMHCIEEQIEPFDPGCIHPRKVNRPTIKAHSLPMWREDK